MEVSGVHIQLKAHIPSAYRLLFKQSYIYSQIHETPWEFVVRNQSDPKMPSIQMLHSTHYAIWVSAMVL